VGMSVGWLYPCLVFQESAYLSSSCFFSFFLEFSLLSTMEIAWSAKFVLCCLSSRLKITISISRHLHLSLW